MADIPTTEAVQPNTALLRSILTDEGLVFNVPDELPEGTPKNVSVTHLMFADEDVREKWLLVFFCHEDAALVRAYAHVQSNASPDQLGTLLSFINLINYSHLLDGLLDYSESSHTVRIRSTFRTLGQGLPTTEFRNWMDTQLLRGDYFSRIFNELDCGVTDAKSELDAAREKVRMHLGLDSHPDLD